MSIEALLERFEARDPDARDELRAMGEAALPALPALADAVRSRKKRLRLDAIFVIEGFGPAARTAVPALLQALRSDDDDTAAAAADTLGAIGVDAVPGLLEALESANWRVRLSGSQGLGVAGPAAKDAVAALLDRASDEEEQDSVATRAIWALGEIGDASVLEALAEVLERDGGLRGCWIAEQLGRFGRQARPCAEVLLNELHREDKPLAIACASALMHIGIYEEQAVWALISCLQEADDDLRIEAAMILGDFGSKAKRAIASLLGAERSDNEELRTQASMAIAKIRPEYAATS